MMTFSNRLKHFLRRFSALLVLSTDRYLVLNFRAYSKDEILVKARHFLRNEMTARVVLGREILSGPGFQTSREMSGIEAFFRKVQFAITGKMLVLSDHSFWVNLQKVLYYKVFVVDWKGAYPLSSWRFHCASYDKKLNDLDLVKARELPVPGDSVVLLGTGPSAPLIFSDFFRDMPVISCNTATKSSRLLEKNIWAHCFVDATFMLGSSSYSEAFLQALSDATKKKRFYLVYNFEQETFVRKQFPHVPRELLLPVFLTSHIATQFRFGEIRIQNALNNVLTSLMYPLAATYFKNIYCVGFDGKGTTQNYYWKHNEEFQFTQLLPKVKEADPAFFANVDFDKYSVEHEANLGRMLDAADKAGTRTIMCHPSSIKPFKDRFDADIFARVQAGIQSEDFVRTTS